MPSIPLPLWSLFSSAFLPPPIHALSPTPLHTLKSVPIPSPTAVAQASLLFMWILMKKPSCPQSPAHAPQSCQRSQSANYIGPWPSVASGCHRPLSLPYHGTEDRTTALVPKSCCSHAPLKGLCTLNLLLSLPGVSFSPVLPTSILQVLSLA